MKSTRSNISRIICFLLIFLWIYAAANKLMDFSMFRVQMHRQLLIPVLKNSLPYILPPAEIITALLLSLESTKKTGLYSSLVMLGAFTFYVALAMFKVLGKIPCSCGGILNKMGWEAHFIFNLFFLLLTAFGLYMVYRERRSENR